MRVDCLGEVITPTAIAAATGVAPGAAAAAGPDDVTVPTLLSASSDPRIRRRVELIWSDKRRVARLRDTPLVAVAVDGAALPWSPGCTHKEEWEEVDTRRASRRQSHRLDLESNSTASAARKILIKDMQSAKCASRYETHLRRR